MWWASRLGKRAVGSIRYHDVRGWLVRASLLHHEGQHATERNGATVAALQVRADQELMLISSTGTLVRTPVADISIVGRNTQGVRLIRLGEGERLTGVERVEGLDAADENAQSDSAPDSNDSVQPLID